MKMPLFLLLILLCGCSAAPLVIPERLTLERPETLIIDGTPPASMALAWGPPPIEDFIISQNADGFIGRDDYQDFAVGRLISTRVEDYLGTISSVTAKSANQVNVTIEDARLNYAYKWKHLAYVKLLVNAQITINGTSRRKIYYRQIADDAGMTPAKTLGAAFDEVAIEMGQDILTTLAK